MYTVGYGSGNTNEMYYDYHKRQSILEYIFLLNPLTSASNPQSSLATTVSPLPPSTFGAILLCSKKKMGKEL